MKINESLNNLLKSTQKISEQLASFAKIANISKAHSSFTEDIEKAQRIASVLARQPRFHGGGEMIPIADCLERSQKLASVLVNQSKFYGGGEAIEKILDFEINADRLKVNIDAINAVIKSNYNEFNSPDVFGVSNSKTLNALKTFQSVSERNLSSHIVHRDKIAERISNFLYGNDFEINSRDLDAPIVSNFSFESFLDYNFDESLFNDFTEYIRYESEIEHERTKIEIFKKLSKSIKRRFRKFTINKREFFRKINSFHFKNLDDYHSLTLVDN